MTDKNTILHSRIGQQLQFLKATVKEIEIKSVYTTKCPEPPLHYHPNQDEEFRVMAGELSVRMNGNVCKYRPGDILFIPKGTAHAMWNESADKTIFTWTTRPGLRSEEVLRTLFELANDGRTDKAGRPGLLQFVMTASKYSKEYRLASPPFWIQWILFKLLWPVAYLKGYRGSYKKYLR